MHPLSGLLAVSLALAAPPSLAAEPGKTGAAETCDACRAALDAVLAHDRRAADRHRDAYRHPAETLSFFQVEPGMTVVDFMPGAGWYTRILAPYLVDSGRYVALNPDVRDVTGRLHDAYAGLGAKFPARAAEWTDLPVSRIAAYNSDELPVSLDGTVDRVLIFRGLHGLTRNGWLDRELATAHRLLKPGGLLGIEQHRAKADAPDSYADGSKGYLREADVIRNIERNGFKLVAKSEINANPRDPADHAAGVWALPPSLRGEADREKYQAIGESDRMTLLFRKQG